MIVRALLFLAAIGAFVPAASAQDAGQVALVAAFPGSVGVQWQIADRWAVRGDVSYNYSKNVTEFGSESSLTFTPAFPTQVTSVGTSITTRTEIRTHATTIGASALVTVHQRDALRLYVAPRFSVAIAKLASVSTSQLVNLPPGFPMSAFTDLLRDRTVDDSTRTPGFGASFGASTKIGDRFAVFGEVGFNYSRSNTPLTSSVPTDSTRTAVGTRGGVGAMLIF